MPWARFDDKFPQHPKVIGLSDAAFRLHVSGICYSASYLTDGLIAAEVVPQLTPRFRRATLAELVDRGLWLAHLDAKVYQIHDYLQCNPAGDQKRAERKAKSQGGRDGAERRWGRREEWHEP